MENKVIAVIFASVILLFFIMISIKMQISTIDGLNQVTTETNERLGYKAAGSFHLLMKGDEFGTLDQDGYEQLKTSTSDGCIANIPGFGQNEPLRFDDGDCGDVTKPLPVPLRINVQGGEDIMYNLDVGESNEGFQ